MLVGIQLQVGSEFGWGGLTTEPSRGDVNRLNHYSFLVF